MSRSLVRVDIAHNGGGIEWPSLILRLPIHETAGIPQDMKVRQLTSSQRQIKIEYLVEMEIVKI